MPMGSGDMITAIERTNASNPPLALMATPFLTQGWVEAEEINVFVQNGVATLTGKVDSAHAAAERITKAGGQVINGPMEVPGGDTVAQVLDAQGAPFGLHQKKD